ncbi:serine/threonine protein kinase [hydrothermal vent metagenome]|uniref:Serine/threonine protein kinase n=1 Tax=hydrothermal vent metagenome TaxID=652676 RepID=A0A3B1DM76_9ZZZZ
MALLKLEELSKELVKSSLVEVNLLERSIDSLPLKSRDSASLLKVLGERQLLTSFQINRIQNSDFEMLVLGDYKLMYQNASGSFARVYRACSIHDGSMIGLKVLRQRWASEPAFVDEFHREAELLKMMRHPNIVPIYEVFVDGKFHFFTMEFIEGGNLREFIRIRKQLSPAEATRFVIDMAMGLEYAISQGITHRDLKMTNVLMSSSGVAKLVDFGLAGHDDIAGISGISGSGEGVQRALEYSALENGTGAPLNDPRSDLYFLGSIYYELLTGQPPYQRTRNRDERRDITRYKNIRPIRSLCPNIPFRVAEAVERLMTIQPNQRYQSASAVVKDLKQLVSQLDDSSETTKSFNTNNNAESDHLPVVMCVEKRVKQQDILREQLTKRGYRVLMMSEPSRAVNRVETNPPDAIILMGESIGDSVISFFEKLIVLGKPTSLVTIAVLVKQQEEMVNQLVTSQTARVLVQPVTLRELHTEIEQALKKRTTSKP